MEMLTYQQEIALFRLDQSIVKKDYEHDYFEMLDLFRQLELHGFVRLSKISADNHKYEVEKTPKGQNYCYNWMIS